MSGDLQPEMAYFVGRYPVHAVLGRGSFGTVYLGTHPDTGVPVAVKVLDRLATTDPAVHAAIRAELHAEAAAMARIHDPHCVRVHDVVDQAGAAALVTEYVDGASLRAVLRERGRLEPRAALSVLHGAVTGLVAVHGAGLVHGDLKPDNVLLDRRGVSHLIDFGLAAPPTTQPVAGSSWSAGTPGYLAPETIASGHTDARSDLYACAVMLFELLTGARPYTGSAEQVLAEHVSAPVPDPRSLVADVGDDLAGLCLSGLAKDPARRPQSAAHFLAWLERAAAARWGATWAAGAGVAGVGGLVGGILASSAGATPLAGAAGAGAAGAGAAAGGAAVGAGAGGVAAGGVSGAAAAGTTAGVAVGTKAVIVAATVAVVAAGTTATVVAASKDDKPLVERADPLPSLRPTSAPPTSTAPPATIRDFDPENATWVVDGFDRDRVTLRDGTFVKKGQYTYRAATALFQPTDPIYADLDGDGDQDMAVPLSWDAGEAGGNAYSLGWYVWLWDAATERAVQIDQPFVAGGHCGDTVDSVSVEDGVLVARSLLAGPGDSCASGSYPATRRVVVRDGFLVADDEVGGAGIVCPRLAEFDWDTTTTLRSLDLRAGPSESAPLLTASTRVVIAPQAEFTPDDGVPGWTLVSIFDPADPTPYDADGFSQPCAWQED